jgi:hypothetical protein
MRNHQLEQRNWWKLSTTSIRLCSEICLICSRARLDAACSLFLFGQLVASKSATGNGLVCVAQYCLAKIRKQIASGVCPKAEYLVWRSAATVTAWYMYCLVSYCTKAWRKSPVSLRVWISSQMAMWSNAIRETISAIDEAWSSQIQYKSTRYHQLRIWPNTMSFAVSDFVCLSFP